MQENRDGRKSPFKGRDHHTEAFTIWMAGGGIKKGFSYGETDEIGYHAISGKIEPFDIQATILHQLGFDHEQFTYPFQGRPFRIDRYKGKGNHGYYRVDSNLLAIQPPEHSTLNSISPCSPPLQISRSFSPGAGTPAHRHFTNGLLLQWLSQKENYSQLKQAVPPGTIMRSHYGADIGRYRFSSIDQR